MKFHLLIYLSFALFLYGSEGSTLSKTDRSYLTSNDQTLGQIADPNKLEETITHAYDKIDENVTERNGLLEDKTDKTGNHQGTWQGLTPSEAGEAVNGARLDAIKQSSFSDAKFDNPHLRVSYIEKRLQEMFSNQASTFSSHAIQKLEKGKSATIVFLGDSTTELNSHTNGNPNHVGLIRTFLENKYGASKVNVVNSGVSGDTITDMMDRTNKDVVDENPDLVVISSGLNDATTSNNITNKEYEENYRYVVEEILANSDADIIIRTPNKTVNHPDVNERLENELNPIAKKVANSYNLGFADLYDYYDTITTDGNYDISAINDDSYHPNEEGQEIIKEFLMSFFQPNGNILKAEKEEFRVYGVDNSMIENNPKMAVENGISYFGGQGFNGDPGEKHTVHFYGTGIELIYTKYNDSGQLKLTLDGSVIESALDLYNADLKWRNYYKIEDLDKTFHTLEVEVLNSKSTSSSGYKARINGYKILGENFNKNVIPKLNYISNPDFSSGTTDYVTDSSFPTVNSSFSEQYLTFDSGVTQDIRQEVTTLHEYMTFSLTARKETSTDAQMKVRIIPYNGTTAIYSRDILVDVTKQDWERFNFSFKTPSNATKVRLVLTRDDTSTTHSVNFLQLSPGSVPIELNK